MHVSLLKNQINTAPMEFTSQTTCDSNKTIIQDSTGTTESTDKFKTEHTDERYVIIPPNWPNEQWERKNECDTKSEYQSSKSTRSKVFDTGHVDNSRLLRFLKVFDKDLDVLHQEKSKAIKDDVISMIEGTVHRLTENHPIFQPCRLIPAGSVAEGTKIGEMNEFDYLIVLDVFRDKELFEIRLHQIYTLILMKTGKHSEKFMTLYPKMLTPFDEHDKMQLIGIRSILMNIFMDDFLLNMVPEWTFWSPLAKVCKSDIATTLHLTSKKHEMKVDVDICLCIPVSKEDCIKATKIDPTYDYNITYFEYISKLMDDTVAEQALEAYAIIGEHIFSRVTIPLLESRSFMACNDTDGRLQTYQYAKCIVSRFLPKRTQLFGCERCCHSLVKSYDLKNVVLFMIKNYTNDEVWNANKLCCRLVEVFGLLQSCIRDKDEESVPAISTYCTPGSIRVDLFSTYNQFSDIRAQKSEFLFTPDSHKPSFGLSSPPECTKSIQTGEPDIDEAVMKYFRHLKNEHWDSYELIDKVYKLLYELHSLEV